MADTTTTQTVSMEGDQSDFNIAGRDLKIITNQHYKPEFFSPSLDDYDNERFISPMVTNTLVELTLNEGFILLGGDGYDKYSWARHIAWNVLKRKSTSGNSIEVKEWASSSNPQNLELHIQKKEKPTIFILPNISPMNVDYNLSMLYRSARSKHHYIIISTNQPFENWTLEEDVKRLTWQPENSEPLYEKRDLLKLLIEKLNEKNGALPEELKDKEFKEDMMLAGNLPLSEVAEKLKTPESIEVFVNTLTSIQTPLNEKVIQDVLDNCQNDVRTLRQWFYHSLSEREQLIALGLCLFEGIYDDQFFAAMETLVEQSWHKRDPSLKSLDYYDLYGLSSFYRLNALGQDGLQKVERHLTEQRLKLLETVWHSHRRQILAALPVIEHLVKESVSDNFVNQELFGTTKRRRLFREVMGDTLCSIGLKPEKSIKGTLLEWTLLKLAAEKNLGVQVVAARAMAQWRLYNQDEKLFDTLERWQHDRIMKTLKTFLDVKYSEDSDSPKILIVATVALTVGFASLYDPPNQLHEKLCALIPKLAENSSNRFISHGFTNYTLPLAVRFHAAQLRDTLHEMAKEPYLNEPIGASLATAIQEGSDEAVEILGKWFRDNCKSPSLRESGEEVTHRQKIMATTAYAYGWIEYKTDDGLISMEKGFQRLREILQKEDSPFVRQAAVLALIRQMIFNFEKVERELKYMFDTMHDIERTLLVDELVKVHLQQRANLENGENHFLWEQRLYPAWIDGTRPLTAVEEVMQNWLKGSDSKKAAQIALEFELSELLIDFQEQEKSFIEQQKENRERERQQKKTESFSLPQLEVKRTLSFTVWLVSRLVAFSRKYREKIRWLLPIVLNKNIEPEKIKRALEKLNRYSDNDIEVICRKLKLALVLIENKKILFPVLAVVLTFLVILLLSLFR
jgi:hypothetical protein